MKGIDRRAFLAGLVTAPAIWPSEVRARMILNQLTGFGGRPIEEALPASLTLVATPEGATGTFNGISIGPYDPNRTIVLGAAIRDDTGGLVAATLDGNAMTNRVNSNTSAGQNPCGILTIDAGAGSPFQGNTTADLVISGPGTLQRSANGVFSVLNLASEVPVDTDTSIANNGAMNIDKWTDGIVIACGYRFTLTTYTWANLPHSQTVTTPNAPANPLGWQASTITSAGVAISTSPTEPTTQRGSVSASWRGASNP